MRETLATFLGFIILTVIALGIVTAVLFGVPAFGRYQALQEERNQIQVNEIRIAQQQQLIQVEKQKAEIRVQNALGIAQSQKIINGSLTDKYLQYLAIEAQKSMAGSPNHTQIYIPVGTNGIPLVKTIE